MGNHAAAKRHLVIVGVSGLRTALLAGISGRSEELFSSPVTIRVRTSPFGESASSGV